MYYLRLKELEDMKKDEKYNDMKNYMNKKYNLKEPCGCPKKDEDNFGKKGLMFFKFIIPALILLLTDCCVVFSSFAI